MILRPDAASALQVAKGRILVVDDDPTMVDILRQSLTLAGYQVNCAGTGLEGVELARRWAPDLVLMDVTMPQMDGFSACQQLKADESTRLVPIIVLTALNDRDDKLRAMELGADEFICKPPDLQELLVRIGTLLKVKRLGDEVLDTSRLLREVEQTKNDLVTMIVHDLRGPLASITNGIELLRRRQDERDSEARQALLASTLLASRQMANMLETMLHVQLLETGKMPAKHEPVLLDQLVDECAQAVRPLLDKDQIRIDVKVEQPPGGLIADGTLLIRVVNNLLFNAIRFSPAGGRIGVWSQTSDRWVVLNVADEGPGIPPDQRESVFEKGFGSGGYRSGGGFGLGLAFCKMAVEAMRGRIWVEEMSQAGALFRVALPLPTPMR